MLQHCLGFGVSGAGVLASCDLVLSLCKCVGWLVFGWLDGLSQSCVGLHPVGVLRAQGQSGHWGSYCTLGLLAGGAVFRHPL